MTTSNSTIPTMNQTPNKWYVQGNWFGNVQRPFAMVSLDGGLVLGQQIVYFLEFPNLRQGFVEKVLAW
jgi:hypothetical protein